jgi:integrase
MRFGEIRALEKRDLDFKVPGIWVRRSMARKEVGTPKNKEARFGRIHRDLAGQLKEWMLRVDGQLLFPGARGGTLPNNSLNRLYRRLAEEAGTKPISSHGARHTVASSYAAMGYSQKDIAFQIGHNDPASTARYTHVRAGEQTAVMVEARWKMLMTGK